MTHCLCLLCVCVYYTCICGVPFAQARNGQPIVSGPWRKKPFSRRKYSHIDEYVFTNAISEEEADELRPLLRTSLDGFVGQAYNYDDHTLTEEWMCSYEDNIADGPSDDDVIRTQLESLMDIMCAQVRGRVIEFE